VTTLIADSKLLAEELALNDYAPVIETDKFWMAFADNPPRAEIKSPEEVGRQVVM